VRKIVIDIDCGKETCDNCKLMYESALTNHKRCRQFSGDLQNEGTGKFWRLFECLSAKEEYNRLYEISETASNFAISVEDL